MGWFDEQIKQRIESDSGVFEDSFIKLTDAVVGNNAARALYDERTLTKNAVEEILKYYHIKIKDIPDSVTELNDQLEWLLRPHGIMRRTITLNKGWYKDAVGAILAFTKKEQRAVALIPGKFGGYYFINPNTGARQKVNSTNQELFDLEGICFYTPLPLKKLTIRDIMVYMFKLLNVSDIVYILIMTGLVTATGMIMPVLNKLIFSEVVESGSIRVLVAMAAFIVSVTITTTIFTTVKQLVIQKVQMKISLNVQAAGMMRVLSLPSEFFREYGSGELAQRVCCIESLSVMLMNSMLSTGVTGAFSLTYIAQIFVFAPTLVVPAIVITLATLVFSLITTWIQMDCSKKQMEMSAKTSSMVYSIITGIQKIRLAGAEKRIFARWADKYAEEARFQYNPSLFLKVNGVIGTAIGLVGSVVMYYAAIKSQIGVADYYAFNTAYGMMSGAIMQISMIAVTVAQIKPLMHMIKPILECEPEVSENKEVIQRISGGVELNNVSFRYDEAMPNVIENLSLKIRPGQYVAICGATGCGKSTLIRLILGFEKPQKGGIFIDGKNINNIDMKSLRRKIGCVMQSGSLFQGDIYSNIVISAPWLTLKDAWEAAELAGIAEDIRQMPMGMNTIIAEGQGGISGGQKQRLMIARAIAPKPKMLIFDEATSALDNITQKKVSQSLDSLKCTRIVVAHRLSTIKQCDRIIVLDKGHIVEDGTYEELITKNGYFAELVERQRVDI